MKRIIERALEVALILGIMYLATGCHTLHGVGRDIEKVTAPYVEDK